MKILLVKFGALGDVIRSTSLLPAIREKWKNAEVSFFTKKNANPFVKQTKLVDRTIVYSKDSIKQLESEHFDLVINLEEDYEACALATNVNKNKLKGFYLKEGKVVSTISAREWFNMSSLGDKTPKVKGLARNDYLKKYNKKTWRRLMSELIGIDEKDCSFHYSLNQKQKNFASDFARRYNMGKSDLVIGINSGAGTRWPAKNLSVEKTAKLAELIYSDLGAKIILFGGPDEIQRNNEIIAKARVPILNSGCGNDLFEFPSLLSLCNLVITSDTLGMHLSLALKRKTVAFFGPTSANEIDLFGLGTKVVTNHKCYCCYKPDCKADSAYSIDELFTAAKGLLRTKLSIVITAFKEPMLGETIKSILRQKINHPHEIIVSVPDKESIELVRLYSKKYKQVKLFKDPGKGKSYALNLLFKELKDKSDILILTDGDVILEDNSINEIVIAMRNPAIGCVTGRVVPSDSRKTKYGFWSHLLADAGAHKARKKLDTKEKFLECSGYLFAFRNNGLISKIPLDVAEDAFIPYMFWKAGYIVGYADKAKVYVKNPTNFSDWLKQRKRTAKAHETLTKYAPDFPKVKSFKNEAAGVFDALSYPKNLQEAFWTLQLIYARLYMWANVFYDTRLQSRHYTDAWERIESTK